MGQVKYASLLFSTVPNESELVAHFCRMPFKNELYVP